MEKSTERISKMEDIKKKRKRKNRRPKRITNVIFFLDEFFKQLTLMYNGSKRWGSVRLNMKRGNIYIYILRIWLLNILYQKSIILLTNTHFSLF